MAGERDGFGTIGSGTRRIKNNNGGGGNSGGGGGGDKKGCALFLLITLGAVSGLVGTGVHTLLS